MLARLCKNSIFPSANSAQQASNNSINLTSSNRRNEYRLPKATASNSQNSSSIQLNPQLPSSLSYGSSDRSANLINCLNRDPPPPYYQKRVVSTETRKHRRPAPIPPIRSQVRSRVEEYRNRLSVSDESESEQVQIRRRSRSSSHLRNANLPPTGHRRINEILLDEDLFCPDLVKHCKSLPVVENDDQDYVEIDELTSQLNLHNEVGLPSVESQLKEPQMGQNLSIKRPKISLTWVLREQQTQHVQQANSINSFKWNEKNLFKKASKSHEKLFSEKYVNKESDVGSEKIIVNDGTNNPNGMRRTERMKRFHNNCFRQRESPESNYDRLNNVRSLSQANLSSIYVTSAQSDSGINRRRRRRKKSAKFGYNINNINDFLSKCSLENPANIPVVLSNASILYQTRSGYQVETPLPLGMVVNSIFKNQNWLYIQTPHNEEGYINFHACLPLGIIQRPQTAEAKCWETNTDIFPSPLTDSEKDLKLRGGTRSECGRSSKIIRINNGTTRSCSEKYLDSLYLLASQPTKVTDHYAQLKPTNRCKVNNFDKINGDYVQLKKNHDQQVSVSSKRQVLLAITGDYNSDIISVKKGDVVKMLACKEYEDKIWYFVRNREGLESYIPGEFASEFL